MFDVLGVLAFFLVIASLIIVAASMFSRKINRKPWVIALVLGLVVFFASYGLDITFDKDEPAEIDFSGIEIEAPTPTPSPTPTPVATPTPEATAAPEETETPETEETSPEATPEAKETENEGEAEE